MEKSPIITYNGVQQTDALDHLIQSRVSRLESTCDRISSCHVAVEWANIRPRGSAPYRIMIDVTVPPNHELAVTKNPDAGIPHKPLETLIREAFDSTQYQLQRLVSRQEQQPKERQLGSIVKLFPVGKCGFIRNRNGDEIYFHRDCVVGHAFDQLTVGMTVQYSVFWTTEGLHSKITKIISN